MTGKYTEKNGELSMHDNKLYEANAIIDNQQEQISKLKIENSRLKDIIRACKESLITDNYKLMTLLDNEKIL